MKRKSAVGASDEEFVVSGYVDSSCVTERIMKVLGDEGAGRRPAHNPLFFGIESIDVAIFWIDGKSLGFERYLGSGEHGFGFTTAAVEGWVTVWEYDGYIFKDRQR